MGLINSACLQQLGLRQVGFYYFQRREKGRVTESAHSLLSSDVGFYFLK